MAVPLAIGGGDKSVELRGLCGTSPLFGREAGTPTGWEGSPRSNRGVAAPTPCAAPIRQPPVLSLGTQEPPSMGALPLCHPGPRSRIQSSDHRPPAEVPHKPLALQFVPRHLGTFNHGHLLLQIIKVHNRRFGIGTLQNLVRINNQTLKTLQGRFRSHLPLPTATCSHPSPVLPTFASHRLEKRKIPLTGKPV